MKAKYILFSIAAMAMVSCGGNKTDNSKQAEAAATETPQVKIAQVTSQDIAQTETYTAVVESDIKNNIAPNMPLRIEKIHVEVGDVVSKGQLLVELDESNLTQLKLQVDNTKTEFGRISQLYAVGGISKSDYDNVKTQLDVLSAQYKQMVQNTRLTSPVSGVVTARNYDNGDMYGGQPVLTIEQTNNVKVIINVSENHYKDIKKGDIVKLSLDAYEGEEFSGKVTIVYPSVDQTTHTFPVEITINNQGQKVRPGMFARAEISYGSQNHVLVPDEALVKQIGAGDRYVYVYHKDNGTVTYNKVQLGKHIDKYYEIISGVEPNAQVVVAGHSRLANDRKVEVVK